MNPKAKLALINQALVIVFPRQEITVRNLMQYFRQRKQGKRRLKSAEQQLSLLTLRWYVRLKVTEAMFFEIRDSPDPWQTHLEIIEKNIHPHEDVLCTSAALNAGVFQTFHVMSIIKALRGQKFGRRNFNWAVNPHETPLLVFLEEGMIPRMVASANRVFQDNCEATWVCYFGMKQENSDIFALITFYLLSDEKGFEEMISIFKANKFFFLWQEESIYHELLKVNKLFPRRLLLQRWHQSA